MVRNTQIHIESPPDREKLVASITFDNEQFAELNRETEKLLVEVYARENGRPWIAEYEQLIDALRRAKERLDTH